jgi:hypothetical protein
MFFNGVFGKCQTIIRLTEDRATLGSDPIAVRPSEHGAAKAPALCRLLSCSEAKAINPSPKSGLGFIALGIQAEDRLGTPDSHRGLSGFCTDGQSALAVASPQSRNLRPTK